MIFQVIYILCCLYLIVMSWKIQCKKLPLKPPYISGRLPLIGHAWKLLGDRKHVFDIIKSISKESLETDGIITLKVGPRVIYLLSNPDDCAQVANECLEKDYCYTFAKPFLGNGLTVADAQLWKHHRKLISPAFRQQSLNGLLVAFNFQAKRLVNQLKLEIGNGPFNVDNYVRLSNLETICMTSFGADISELGGLHQQYLEATDEILDIITERFQKIWLHNDFIYNRSNLKKREDCCARKIKRFTDAILAKRKKEMKEIKDSSSKSEKFLPFMSYLLKISKETDSYAEEDVLFETNTMVAAGYDTTAFTITVALMLLGSYPDVQKKAFDELREVFGNSNRDVVKDDLMKLVYIDAVVKETLRIYPIAPLIARHLVKDVKVQNYTLKAGNGIGILIWAMHRHPLWGPDAEAFRPERWLDGSLPSNPHAFGGFSLGKRSCIGKTYAMMSIKTVLSHVIRNYQISSDITQLQIEMHGSLRASSGQYISIEERKCEPIV